jgi:hypothetical protein
LGTVPGVCLYFVSYELAKKKLENSSYLKHQSHLVNFAAGFVAEAFSCIIWVPTDVLKERAQATNQAMQGTSTNWSATRHIISSEGFRGLYRGYGATLASFGPFSALYFMFVESFKSQLKGSRSDTNLNFYQTAGACAAAGGVAAFLTAPLDLVKVRMQVERRTTGTSTYTSVFSGLRHVWKSDGIRGLFRGGMSRVWFAVPNTAITMTIMESIKNRLES